MAETPVIKAKNLEPNVVEVTVKAAQVFNSFLVNYVANTFAFKSGRITQK